jgi:hypothetical protein
MIKTPEDEGTEYRNPMKIDALEEELQQLSGVESTSYVSDKQCRLVSIAEGLPSHCAAGELCIKSIADAFEGDTHEGDLFIFNAPYLGNTHCGDINIAAPVFFEGEHLFWMVNRSHLPDIGAYQPTSYSLYFMERARCQSPSIFNGRRQASRGMARSTLLCQPSVLPSSCRGHERLQGLRKDY